VQNTCLKLILQEKTDPRWEKNIHTQKSRTIC